MPITEITNLSTELTTEAYRMQEITEMKKRRSSTFSITTVVPYTTTDPSFTTTFKLYDKSTTQQPEGKEPNTLTGDIDTMKKEIQKELDRIKSSLDKLGDRTGQVLSTSQSPPLRTTMTNVDDIELQKLEKARQELMKELEKVDSTLARIKIKQNRTLDESNKRSSPEKSLISLDEITDHILKKVCFFI